MAGDYSALPAVDRVLADDRLQRARAELGPDAVREAVRGELQARRTAIAAGARPADLDEIAVSAAQRADAALRPSLRPVINATGVIIHTNLGRAPLSDSAIEAMAAVSRGYSNLEFDLAAGERGSRHDHLESLLRPTTRPHAAPAL